MTKLLTNWEPEDSEFWKREGKSIARRNLYISVPDLMLAFIVWQLWSVLVIYLRQVGFDYTENQLAWLAALPALSGATLRIFYSFMIPVFGGRLWSTLSTASLLIPTIGIGYFIQNTSTSYTTMVILALLCGFGGANFSSSMANIGHFFPKSEKGRATGLNAGLGNLGVSVVQFMTPFIIGTGLLFSFGNSYQITTSNGLHSTIWLQNAAYFWVPFIALFSLISWFGMNSIASVQSSIKNQLIIFKRKHNWIMCILYLGTFGSFIGFSAALPLLIKYEFPSINPLTYAFLGPLLGSLFRVVGGSLSDKISGARVTQWSFIAIVSCVIAIVYFMSNGQQAGNFLGFLISFLALFIFIGLGNGSTFAQVPNIFIQYHQKLSKNKSPEEKKQALLNANKEAGAVLGFIGAIGAYGGFFIPKINGSFIAYTGSIKPAFYCFIAFYLVCIIINWWYYLRKNAEIHC